MSEPHRNVTPEVRLADSSRVEAFTDAVLAIVMTILVLELRPPSYEEGSLLKGLLSQWASYVAFLVSFLYVGIVWMNHHALFSRIRFVDRGMQWVNFSILLTAALLPFPTAVLAEALREGNPTDQRVAVALYALVAGLMSAAWIRVFPYLRDHPQLVDPETDLAYFHAQRIRPWIGVILYTAAGLLGLLAPIVGLILFVVMVVFHGLTSEGLHETPFLRRHAPSAKPPPNRSAPS
jgi:uncharacterized membrane protein